ncbi:MAG TPA: DUF2207 domain-containing protein, partial [Chryseolinea sp.]|nr:DUF2207 domain-containing protein [Chryseolinea sp.]
MNYKKIFATIFFILFFFLFPQQTHAETIQNFDTDITINKEGTITVSEKIIYNFGNENKHGIFRNIPTVKTNQEGKKFRLEFNEISVTDELRKPYQYTKTSRNDELQLKIGDPDKTITGVHTYIITYQVIGALTYFSDHDELYWNSTGNDWNVPIELVNTTIQLPTKLLENAVRVICYTGYSGSTYSNCSTSYSNGAAIITTNERLNASEGLTVVVGFPKDLVAVVEPKEVIPFFETFIGKIVFFFILIFGVLISLFWYIYYPIRIVYKWYVSG